MRFLYFEGIWGITMRAAGGMLSDCFAGGGAKPYISIAWGQKPIAYFNTANIALIF